MNLFHSFRAIIGDKKFSLGIFDQINPILVKKLSLSLDIFLFEFDFRSIQVQMQINELSYLISPAISFQNLKNLIMLNRSHLLKKISLLDEY